MLVGRDDVLRAAETSLGRALAAVAGHLRSMPALVFGTYRDDELAPSSSLLGVGGNSDRIPLRGLAQEQVVRPPSDDEVKTVHRHTGGNPLFVTEVGRLVAAGSPAAVPSGVSSVLARRLARLSPRCDRVLGAAAVLGTTFDVETVAGFRDVQILPIEHPMFRFYRPVA